jgi:hypothetical protein
MEKIKPQKGPLYIIVLDNGILEMQDFDILNKDIKLFVILIGYCAKT